MEAEEGGGLKWNRTLGGRLEDGEPVLFLKNFGPQQVNTNARKGNLAVPVKSRTDKFHFRVMVFNLCRAEILKNRNVCSASQLPAEGLCHFNSAPYYDYIYILRGTLQEYISYITSYNVTFQSQFVCRFGD